LQYDFLSIAASRKPECTVEAVANPLDDKCWSGKSVVAKYNVQKVKASFGFWLICGPFSNLTSRSQAVLTSYTPNWAS
jgi:hypothetical protein